MADTLARDAYYAYGVDLIRTAGLLLRTTPSVIYRASMLLQRFEASVDACFRSRYIAAEDMPALRQDLETAMQAAQQAAIQSTLSFGIEASPSLANLVRDDDDQGGSGKARTSTSTTTCSGTEYLIPLHAQHEMRSGLTPLVDLHAPLDYCLQHLVDQEDIVYLAAACLLISTKMEDPSLRIRAIVNTCMRLSERRAGVVVNELQKPPPARYEDFKACVVDAEEVVLHQLGFQTFVDSPYKYVLLYLNFLIDSRTTEPQQEEKQVTPTAASATVTRPSAPVALTQWMVRAVQLVNDLPRCRQLLKVHNDVLALYAIRQTCPPDVALPPNLTDTFGVPADAIQKVADVYAVYRKGDVGTRRAAAVLADVRSTLTVAAYRTVDESEQYRQRIKELTQRPLPASALEVLLPLFSMSPSPLHSSATSGYHATATATTAASIEELRDLIGASFPSPLPPSSAPLANATGGVRRDRHDMVGNDGTSKKPRPDL